MKSAANSPSRTRKSWPWRPLFAGLLLAGAFSYVWIIPLFRPRGAFLWGHYRVKDIYLGIPIALAAVCALIVLLAPQRYRRKIALRLTTVALALLFALALCDVGYAFGVMGAAQENYWLDQAHISRRYSTGDPELGFVRKPFVSWRGYVPDANRVVEYRTDKNGFRNATERQRADIVFIGDSFTEAATVSEKQTFARLVEQSTGLSAINLARGAYGPQQELLVLRRYGLDYEPRFVVWQLFEGNDLADAEAFAQWKKNPRRGATPFRERYFENSLLHEALANTRTLVQRGPMATLHHRDGTSTRVNLRYRYEPDQPATISSAMSETLLAIETGHELCRSRGIQLLLVVVPAMVKVMQPYVSFDHFEDRRVYLPERIPGDKDFTETIKEFCAQIGCTVVDSFDVLREAAAPDNRGLYIPNDEHLDTRGHQVIGSLITGWIQSRLNTGLPQESSLSMAGRQ